MYKKIKALLLSCMLASGCVCFSACEVMDTINGVLGSLGAFFGEVNNSSDIELDVNAQGGAFTKEDIQTITNSDLSIHFLELGNEYTGDCTLIKVGDTEVLIDAGSRKGSAEAIVPYIAEFCTDGVLE